MQNSPPYLCLNLGFKGDIRKAGATASNLWCFQEGNDINKKYWNFLDPNEDPLLYVSFPSLKDPEHESGPELKETGECITFVDWKTFKKWENSVTGPNRPEEYKKLKEMLT